MTADNLSFSLEIDFIPDVEEGRQEFIQKMKDTAKTFHGAYSLSQKKTPVISGLTVDDINQMLPAMGLSAFGAWPSCILTCRIQAPVPIHAIGMSDGWDIYLGKKTFFAFAQFPADALQIMRKAATYYLDHETFQTLEEFVNDMGFDAFRDTVLGNTVPGQEGVSAPNTDEYYGSSWGMPNVPPLKEGDFVRPENNIMQILEVYPDMGPFLMEYGMSCVGCFVSYDENLWQAAQAHGMDVFEIIGEMNEYIADKYNKKLISGDTPMEDILTLYPQLLSILQSFGLEMPADVKTPLGKVCEKAGVAVSEVEEKCNDRLRGAAEA
jgi:hybrid cluster-associated redox disulfide protein